MSKCVATSAVVCTVLVIVGFLAYFSSPNKAYAEPKVELNDNVPLEQVKIFSAGKNSLWTHQWNGSVLNPQTDLDNITNPATEQINIWLKKNRGIKILHREINVTTSRDSEYHTTQFIITIVIYYQTPN